jgi:hypothetical protein
MTRRQLGGAQPVLTYELRAMHSHDHQRRRTALDRLPDVFADAIERITPLALDLVGEDLDIDARQRIGQRLTPSRFCARVLADTLLVDGWLGRGGASASRTIRSLAPCTRGRQSRSESRRQKRRLTVVS